MTTIEPVKNTVFLSYEVANCFAQSGVECVFFEPVCEHDKDISTLVYVLEVMNIKAVICKDASDAIIMAAGYSRIGRGPGTVLLRNDSSILSAIEQCMFCQSESDSVFVFLWERGESSGESGGIDDLVELGEKLTSYCLVFEFGLFKSRFPKMFKSCQSGAGGVSFIRLSLRPERTGQQEYLMAKLPANEDNYKDIESQIASLYHHLTVARYPIIVTGVGASITKCRQALSHLLHVAPVTVVSTFQGFSLLDFEHSDYFLGRVGSEHESSPANKALYKSDLVILIGCHTELELNDNVISPDVTIYGITSERYSLENCITRNNIVFDISETINRLTNLLVSSSNMKKMKRKKESSLLIKRIFGLGDINSCGGHLAWPIYKCLDENTIVVCDTGDVYRYFKESLISTSNANVLFSNSNEINGFGLYWAIGISLSNPHIRVISISDVLDHNMDKMDYYSMLNVRIKHFYCRKSNFFDPLDESDEKYTPSRITEDMLIWNKPGCIEFYDVEY
ncbi:thiamine pyrophosphate-binding protein [Vibrio sp. RE88]|uniref:thiamine pyrophosphate-binding protein n=1 Tax=Vibrio sp. RE88 TaxID=2607610 RepID=UPI001493D0C5|nr:thiamine pyrophosphate-binding protein [Vibrio sp. RE88]NOH62274.1 hypothetical protein [Vibrio sp. RE88]